MSNHNKYSHIFWKYYYVISIWKSYITKIIRKVYCTEFVNCFKLIPINTYNITT